MGNINVGPLSLGQLIIIIGAIVGIVSVFLTWFAWNDWTITGWAFAFDKTGFDGFFKMCPFIAWILMVVILVGTLLSLKIEVPKFVSTVAVIALGIIAIVLVVVFGLHQESASVWSVVIYDFKIFDHAAIGTWLMIVAGIATAIGGALTLKDE